MVVGIVGDGDFLMGNTASLDRDALPAAVPFLVANNRSFYNDELHQERVAKTRGRPVENKWIGQRIDEPDIDLAMMARAQGAVGIGPVRELSQLRSAVEEGIKKVQAGEVCVVDVRVMPGYDSAAHPTPAAASRR
jgi:thiamine pyrophosphate-dependent acetolactate synthase large subunit-like protein